VLSMGRFKEGGQRRGFRVRDSFGFEHEYDSV
jgi:hypothetical protein